MPSAIIWCTLEKTKPKKKKTTPSKSKIPIKEEKILFKPFFSNRFVKGNTRKAKIDARKRGTKKLLAIINPKNKSVINNRCVVAL